jgi:hypothetical protein
MSPDVLLRLAAESEPEVPRPVARLAGVV